jgi:hypothetical protein
VAGATSIEGSTGSSRFIAGPLDAPHVRELVERVASGDLTDAPPRRGIRGRQEKDRSPLGRAVSRTFRS